MRRWRCTLKGWQANVLWSRISVMEGVRYKVRKFRELSGCEKRLFLEAFMLHLWVGLMLKVVPFRLLPRLFGNPEVLVPSPQSSVSSPQSADIELVKNAIGRATGISPWKNRCLVSSLAGRYMLRRRKILSQLSLGVGKNVGGKTIAHAWLRAGEIDIVPTGTSFHELYHF